ncbi:MAG: hypothetical protein FIA97_14795 [Methylococcaceae bacterium]|nr:hypothetical protein [Methylococcaceae bacterium]
MQVTHIMLGGMLFAIAAEALLLASNRKADDEWATFRDAHHCIPVAVTDGSNRSGYRCDDGKVYYRWRQMR